MWFRTILALVGTVSFLTLTAQDAEVITLTNASFEDMPRHSKPPRGWYDCGFQDETPPDVQPSGQFSVTKPAFDGNTYLGMVVRDNDTWEAVSQRLNQPMREGQCYSFSISLARSELYVSVSRSTPDETANYTKPAKLRIYGGFDYCDKAYLLGESELVESTRWREFSFKFEPIAAYTHIIFEVFYQTPTLFPYNGNVLLDKASSLQPIPCDEELAIREEPTEAPPEEDDPFAAPEPAEETPGTNVPPVESEAVTPTPPPVAASPDPEVSEPEPATDTPTSFRNIDRSTLREGQTLRIDNLLFEVDKSVITTASYDVLDELFEFLDRNEDLIVEIGGHTNGLCSDVYCDELSTDRARAVAEYLVRKGIEKDRLSYKGYGKREPIASNDTLSGRKQNQRVEVKILSFNG